MIFKADDQSAKPLCIDWEEASWWDIQSFEFFEVWCLNGGWVPTWGRVRCVEYAMVGAFEYEIGDGESFL